MDVRDTVRTLKGSGKQTHPAAYGSDGAYASKPNREEIFEFAYELMHESDPRRWPTFY
ncbi:MAG: hypothetical protein HYU52_16125 [Acidobacteria bacterium]|nr:hypothetical protein [Acidobacteriota bacterium]